ncbi:MAG: hypothetical protein ACOX3S_08495 [Anaerolineae bacterium]|jgi:hypothetical protein
MPALVAFASLPFGIAGGPYQVNTVHGMQTVHVTAQTYTPFLTIASHPAATRVLAAQDQAEGLTSYSWYDHPFVLRVVFGRNIASLGSINSSGTIVLPLEDDCDWHAGAFDALRDTFAAQALAALNNLIAVVRGKAKLYHVFDLRRDDIDVTVRADDGSVLAPDPLQAELIEQEEALGERFDLARESEQWYEELRLGLGLEEPVGLADDLLIEAERALAQRFPRQAIATCHTTIEAAVSVLLTHGMQRQGLSDSEIDHALSTRSLTSKLEALLRRYSGFSLKRDNPELWQRFSEINDLRNDIVHRGLRPTHDDATYAIQVTRSILRWLKMVRGRNR